jgi:hypothetical protein
MLFHHFSLFPPQDQELLRRSASCEQTFTPRIPRLFPQPVVGRIEVHELHTPRVRFAGTSWSIKMYEPNSQCTFFDGQEVNIVGREGICLLISAPLTQVRAISSEEISHSPS